jgi:hypothetical protein
MLENLKIHDQKETFFNSLISRANSEVLLMDLATIRSNQNNTSFDYEYQILIEQRNLVVNQIVDNMQKFV